MSRPEIINYVKQLVINDDSKLKDKSYRTTMTPVAKQILVQKMMALAIQVEETHRYY